jgi:hypothetical protein
LIAMRRLPDPRTIPPADSLHHEGIEDGDAADRARREGPRVHVWHTSRTLPFPGALVLLIVAPLLLAVGVATIGLFAAGVAGLLSAPRVVRRGGDAGGRSDADRRRTPTIILDQGDYRRMD